MKQIFISIFGFLYRLILFGLLFFAPCLYAQQGVLQSYTYPVGDDLENQNCNVYTGLDGKVYISPYSNGLYEVQNAGLKRIKTPESSTINHATQIPNRGILLGASSGLWYVSNQGQMSCLDSCYIMDLIKVEKGYYVAAQTNFLESRLYFLDAELKKSNSRILKGLITFYPTRDTLFVGTRNEEAVQLYSLKNNQLNHLRKIQLDAQSSFIHRVYHSDSLCIIKLLPDKTTQYLFFSGNKLSKTLSGGLLMMMGSTTYLSQKNESISELRSFQNQLAYQLLSSEIITRGNILEKPEYCSYFIPSGTSVSRYLTYLQVYPKLFQRSHSHSIFSLIESASGDILAASYERGLTAIRNHQYFSFPKHNLIYSNGAFRIGNQVVFIHEDASKRFLLCIDSNRRFQSIRIPDLSYFFYGFTSSKGEVYLGSSGKGLWKTDSNSFLHGEAKWTKIDSDQSKKLTNILTITEDTLGRIWFAHPKTGFGVYDAKKGTTRYILKNSGEIAFGAMASIRDEWGTLWFGTQPGGVAYYNAYHSSVKASDIQWLRHPLFDKVPRVTALTLHRNHLILAAYDKILALNLDSFYAGKINLKYLSAQESNLSSYTEQNTMLTARDGSIWYATHDNLYRWDFDAWLQLPKNRIRLYSTLTTSKQCDTLISQRVLHLAPMQNNFSLKLNYSSPDLLPRYLRTALQFEDDILTWSRTATNTEFTFTNLSPGKYQFYVQVMEFDGTLTELVYPIFINDFWYKQWWIWLIISSVILLTIGYIFWQHTQKKLALSALQLIEANQTAELERIQNLKSREMSRLKLQSIANKIRPHFILNALNTIGAALPAKSKSETLLARLSKSLNYLFEQSKNEKNTHDLKQEWEQCLTTIDMNRIMYLPNLQVDINLPLDSSYQIVVPIGLLQIPVENALLHGLRNKLEPPHQLALKHHFTKSELHIEILDNGIGFQASRNQSNARKHGSGLKSIFDSLEIYNSLNENPLRLTINENEDGGTRVVIIIPLNFSYEI